LIDAIFTAIFTAMATAPPVDLLSLTPYSTISCNVSNS